MVTYLNYKAYLTKLLKESRRLETILNDLVCAVIEFGAFLPKNYDFLSDGMVNPSTGDLLAKALKNDLDITIVDVEENRSYNVKLGDFVEGLMLCLTEFPRVYANIIEDKPDFEDIYIYIQFVAFKNMKYD